MRVKVTLYDSKNRYNVKDEHPPKILEEIGGCSSSSIKSLSAEPDRGIECWKEFVSLCLTSFPNLEQIIIDQDYSYHQSPCKFQCTNLLDDLIEILETTTLRELIINDGQSLISLKNVLDDRVKSGFFRYESNGKLLVFNENDLISSEEECE